MTTCNACAVFLGNNSLPHVQASSSLPLTEMSNQPGQPWPIDINAQMSTR